jgi:hypothetical protein
MKCLCDNLKNELGVSSSLVGNHGAFLSHFFFCFDERVLSSIFLEDAVASSVAPEAFYDLNSSQKVEIVAIYVPNGPYVQYYSPYMNEGLTGISTGGEEKKSQEVIAQMDIWPSSSDGRPKASRGS